MNIAEQILYYVQALPASKQHEVLDFVEFIKERTTGLELTTEPTRQPHYSLDDLLAECDASAEISDEEQAWLDSNPVGRELL